jgi:Sec-independent protein translocase protein TatA
MFGLWDMIIIISVVLLVCGTVVQIKKINSNKDPF